MRNRNFIRESIVVSIALGGLIIGSGQKASGQVGPRLNKVIEALEEGRPAIANQEWRFVDMEHSAFSGE